jgi:ligand-binding sensor domain-containing protein
MAIDRAGQQWLGGLDPFCLGGKGGASKFDGRTWATYTTADGLPDNCISAIAADASGNVWFGLTIPLPGEYRGGIRVGKHGGLGAGKFDGQMWQSYTVSDGLAHNDIRAIVTDDAGRVWFGTWGGGVSEFDGQSWTTYKTAGLADNRVTAIAVDEAGHKWFGTRGGVSQFDGQSWTTYTTVDGLLGHSVYEVKVDQAGHIWVGATDGVSEYDGQTWLPHPLSCTTVIVVDESGHIWASIFEIGPAGPWGDVYAFDGQTWIRQRDPNVPRGGILSIAVDQAGHKWFGSGWMGGVSKFDGQSWTNYKTDDGLADNIVYTISVDGAGHKWFGTLDGVSKFDDQKWTTYNSLDGLANDRVYAITIDAMERRWFGTQNGVTVFGRFYLTPSSRP